MPESEGTDADATPAPSIEAAQEEQDPWREEREALTATVQDLLDRFAQHRLPLDYPREIVQPAHLLAFQEYLQEGVIVRREAETRQMRHQLGILRAMFAQAMTGRDMASLDGRYRRPPKHGPLPPRKARRSLEKRYGADVDRDTFGLSAAQRTHHELREPERLHKDTMRRALHQRQITAEVPGIGSVPAEPLPDEQEDPSTAYGEDESSHGTP